MRSSVIIEGYKFDVTGAVTTTTTQHLCSVNSVLVRHADVSVTSYKLTSVTSFVDVTSFSRYKFTLQVYVASLKLVILKLLSFKLFFSLKL